MNLFLIGSRAVDKRILQRDPKDWDFIDLDAAEHSFSWLLGERTEISAGSFLNNEEICDQYAVCTIEKVNNIEFTPISLKGLAILKRSHLHRPINFQTHIRDYHNIKKVCGDFNEQDLEILNRRIKLTKKQFPDRTPKLNMSNEDFFDDKVRKYYVHDDIHQVIAHDDKPIYEKLKSDQSQAYCKKDLWEQLPYVDKLKCVLEEAYVIALERWIIPNWIENNKNYPPKIAFQKALEKICTTLTSGYFRDFAIDNWPIICHFSDQYFVVKFKNANLKRIN